MEDLEHSMCMAEDDWTSFWEDSEACALLLPSLACPESCSDSEDVGSSRSFPDQGPQDEAGSCVEEVPKHRSVSAGEQDDLKTEAVEDNCERNSIEKEGVTSENIPEETKELSQSRLTEQERATETRRPDPLLSCDSTQLNLDEPLSSVMWRPEKERWFVTVNDSPARQRPQQSPGYGPKKKRRQKKTRKSDQVCHRNPRLEKQPRENGLESGMNRDNSDSDGERDAEGANIEEKSEGFSIRDSCAEEKASDKLVTHEISELDRNNYESFSPKDQSRKVSLESEFHSTHSLDSENYLSASESLEEPQHFLEGNQLSQSLPSLTMSSSDSCHAVLLCEVTASEDCQALESVEAVNLTSSSAADKIPDNNSTCYNDADTRGLQNAEKISLLASGSQPSPVPDVTLTPASEADSPETYAQAVGNTRPVYAISAFWDEMEKLTINDILHLRMGRSTPLRQTPNSTDLPTNDNCLGDSLSDRGLMDTSDTADSDYFTQTDESKPDRSSCEFSSSDFEEEYWQLLGASQNSSPDPEGKTHRGDSALLKEQEEEEEEEESSSSEGKETPVPSGDLVRDGFGSESAWSGRLSKSKSVRNIQALNTEDLSLQLLLVNDESRVTLQDDSLGKLIPEPFLSNMDHLISFPQLFEYFLTDNVDAHWITPQDISVAPVFDYTLCSSGNETSFSSLQNSEEKPIPIFSCSHPTVRELTFPNHIFLSTDCEEAADATFSPIRVVSHTFIRGSDGGTSRGGFHSWKSLLSLRRIRFHDKGCVWNRGAGAWMFPAEAEISIKGVDPAIAAVTKRNASTAPYQLCGELEVQQAILETIQTTRREGIFSALKQSDMCLVCIAFASWVLKSSDPKATDAWKAALLANVSALSAIQYLRQYVKTRNPSHP